ncbi:glycosyltransferase [Candidatus Thiomargarita nelsonii]|uniref:Glycosyltransferase n=1 Tax=Candidatus Thiomargarita nelsonii TaxID=1003181 RepID=A0A0A6RXI4_9GAMM|nr:glycosyltransferase [Candidatus Thiomargarita nelsonii]
MKQKNSIGVVIPTHNAHNHLKRCLTPVLASLLKPRVLVIDSSSKDDTIKLAQQMGAETLVIPQEEFNHGATRELARKHLNTDIVVMMTQDAYPQSSDFLQYLVAPLLEGTAAVSYARQIPHEGADFFEAFPRQFNYPEKSHIRGIEDLETYGSYTFFCSDSCAAWINSALDEIGGFSPALVSEEHFAATRLLEKGHRIAYVAEAIVHHSHHYSLLQEFKRYFDVGYARRLYIKEKELFFRNSQDKKYGSRLAKAMLEELIRKKPLAIPYAIFHLAAKYLGYKVGTIGTKLSLRIVRLLSGQDYYWSSIYNTHKK